MSINWEIKKENIENLKFHEKNPRTFTAKGLADLKKSISKYSDANIITINADNTVLGGHARLTIMKEMGIKEVDVKYPDKLLTEKQCEELLVRLNANVAGIWDYVSLQNNFDIDELSQWGLDLFNNEYANENDDLMDNENLQELDNNKRLAVSKMSLDKYLCILFDNKEQKKDFIDMIKNKINNTSNIDIKTQYCDYKFQKKVIDEQ